MSFNPHVSDLNVFDFFRLGLGTLSLLSPPLCIDDTHHGTFPRETNMPNVVQVCSVGATVALLVPGDAVSMHPRWR